MTEESILQTIKETFEGVFILTADGSHYIYYSPEQKMPDKTFPFATLVTKDDHDQASNLSRPGVFRLNIGVSKATFLDLFGQTVPRPNAAGVIDTGYDTTALDHIMPHPVYGNLFWVCVLNPSDETFEKVRELLSEAYKTAVRQAEKH